MHILEDPKTEGIDWSRFYGPDAQDVTKWGPKAWALEEDWAKHIPCPHCREFAVTGVSALRDMVNLHKTQGEFAGRVYDLPKLKSFIAMVHDVEKHLSTQCVGSQCNGVRHKVA